MTTASFLQKILPTRGVRFLAEWVSKADHPKGGYFIHFPFGEDSDDTMAHRANELSASGRNVYFACASYREVLYKTTPGGHEYPAGRTQDNVRAVKALWLDLDVGKADENKCYPTQRDAALDVMRLVKTLGLPDPMLVSSGAGLHVYWPLTEDVDGDRWFTVASQLKSVCAHLKVKADPSRTADSASVLRPVGTKNPKHGKAVRVMRNAEATPIGDIAAKLADYILANHVEHTRRDNKPSLNQALIGGPVEYPPSHADEIIKRCAVLAHFHDKMGNVAEPFWYAALGLLKHCVDGETIAHRWSEGHPRYDYDATQGKLDQWTYGPPTCGKLESESCLNVCASCPQREKIKSPVQLGHVKPVGVEVALDNVTLPAVDSDTLEDPEKIKLPDGFTCRNGALHRWVDDDEVVFSDTLFYPVSRVRGEDGEWSLSIRMNVAGHYWRTFDLPQTLIPDARGLARHLAKYEIIILGAVHAMHYLKEYVKDLMRQNEQLVTYDRFGWDDGRFVIGTTAFMPDGTTEPVLVTDNVLRSGKALDCSPSGSLEEWIRLIDLAYNRPNAEKYQFVIATAFASPLIALADLSNYRGIPVALTGEGGIGKSSVCKAASTIYAHPNALLVDATEKNGSTLQGLFGLASLFNGVPLLMDEMTERDPKDFAPLMYSLSNGQGKLRMTAGGKFADTVKPFCGIKFTTSNNDITDEIYNSEKRQVAEAVEMRCFEIGKLTREEINKTFAGVDMKDLLEHQLFKHHGVAAQVYLPAVAARRDDIIRTIEAARVKLGKDISAESRERYYIDTIAFAHVAAGLAHRLGLIRWNVDKMTKWAIAHMKNLRRNFSERSALVDDNISLFLSWLQGSIIVTRTYPSGGRTRADEVEPLLEPMRGRAKARLAIKDQKFYVRADALAEWAKEFNQSASSFYEQLARSNYIICERRLYLGKGTNQVTGQARVFELDYRKVGGVVGVETDGNVATIKREGVL